MHVLRKTPTLTPRQKSKAHAPLTEVLAIETIQSQKTMMKRLAVTSLVMLGLSIASGHADFPSYLIANANAKLPPQAIVRCLRVSFTPAT